jgi:hypothetical protein
LIGINPRQIRVWVFAAGNLAAEGGNDCILEGELGPRNICTLGDPSSLVILVNVIVRCSSLVHTVDVIAKPEGESDALTWRKVNLVGLILVVVMVIIVVVRAPSTKDPLGRGGRGGWIMSPMLATAGGDERQPSYHRHRDISEGSQW